MVELISENTLFALFLLLALGTAIGSFSWRGISLGSSAVLLVALVFGHFGILIPPEVRDFGLVLFVYSIGLQVGPRFFKAAREQGGRLLVFCSLSLSLSLVVTVVSAQIFHIPADVATGVFSGSLTSTPALAAAVEFAEKIGFDAGNISVGYGIAYPISLILMVLLLQTLPVLVRPLLDRVNARSAERRQYVERLVIRHFRVENPACVGKTIEELHIHTYGTVNISRLYRAGSFLAASRRTALVHGDIVTVVGSAHEVERVGLLFGSEEQLVLTDTEITTRDVHVLASTCIGKTIRDLRIWEEYDVVITRIKKPEYDLPAVGSYELEHGDVLHVVGAKEDVDRFAAFASTMDEKAEETNFLPYVLGLTVGILIGLVPITLYGGIEIKLGMATGAFLVSLVIGYFGKIGSLKVYVPQAAFNVTRDLGLMLFLAGVGTNAGARIVDVVLTQGASLVLGIVLTTLVAILIPLAVLLLVPFFTFSSVQGALSGYMTNLPALLSARAKMNFSLAMLEYATFYPYALILKIMLIQVLMVVLAAL